MVLLGGQFKSATHGQFKSAQGGQFDRILHKYNQQQQLRPILQKSMSMVLLALPECSGAVFQQPTASSKAGRLTKPLPR